MQHLGIWKPASGQHTLLPMRGRHPAVGMLLEVMTSSNGVVQTRALVAVLPPAFGKRLSQRELAVLVPPLTLWFNMFLYPFPGLLVSASLLFRPVPKTDYPSTWSLFRIGVQIFAVQIREDHLRVLRVSIKHHARLLVR